MSCVHKFFNDLQLQYVDWTPKTLFIGTFNPEWTECKNNYAEWFYGRTLHNEFWCILSKVYNQPSQISGNRSSWIEFCRKNNIAVTDILSSIEVDVADEIQRAAVCKFKDDDIANFEVAVNNIPEILRNFPSIKQVCITRQTLSEFWEDCFMDTLQYRDCHLEQDISLKFLRSPSRGARKGVVGNFCDFVANRWVQQGFEI